MNRRKRNLVLDNTLRYLYIALRKRGCSLMAIEFMHRGRKWRVDTVEEAIQLRNRLDAEDGPDATWIPEVQDTFQNVVEANAPNPWTPDLVTEFLDGVGELQFRFLRVLTDHNILGEGKLTSRILVKKLRLDSELALAGVVSGLSKQLKKMSLSPYDVYQVTVLWSGKEKERSFQINYNFLLSARELGWPEAWEDKKK